MTTSTTVQTSYGALQGAIDRGVTVFRGVPFARPPLGALRFAAPEPPESWTGLREATAFGPSPMQAPSAISSGLTVGGALSEDCLTLNIWTPAVEAGRRPVLVWLHGGAFVTGAGSMPMSHGAALARRGDVVVVTVNYRLGLFGFLRGIDVCGDALPSTGNAGLFDQLAALRWVRQEIAAFGGDPANVTVVGQSAGARSIATMLAMPQARGLFQKAVLQSGAGLAMAPDTANRVMSAMLADVSLAPHAAGRLRALSAGHLLEMQSRVTPRAAGIAYGPVADGVEVAADLEAAVAAGSSAGIPMLIGTNLEEQTFFSRMDSAVEHLTDGALLARLADPRTAIQAWDNARFDPAEAVTVHRQAATARGEDATAADIWTSIMTERRFRVPAMRLAELHAAHTPQTYAYLFTWRSPGWDGKLGAGHVVEVPFVFGTLDAPDSQDLVPACSPIGRLSEQMQDAWLAFARTGSPQTPELSGWEPYTATRRTTMLLGTTCGPMDAPYEAERHYWATRAGPAATHPRAGA